MTEHPTLVLLHGLAGSGALWDGLDAAAQWDGPVVAPDLAGHGAAAPLERYSFGALAARVAADLDPDRPVAVLGHSLGGVVALALASGWFGIRVESVVALGVKLSWSPDELAKGRALGGKPPKVFETRAEAESWAGKLAGLPAGPAVEAGGGWRAAVDQRAFAVGRPDLPGLLAAARARVTLAAGEQDVMSPVEHLRTLVPNPVVLPGVGHNAHVEDPAAVAVLLEYLR
ncbi:alpha/beta fold hydrolase [Actinokineospora terrae]|uniref:Lysophospholipase, alpha-beta hydrolase superfamily n=1 Tax=Actinokineospora terrae TaxID=155974 RepID=A0A1H9VAV8_9PSEU|nr:alpha/beta fold hydrolase [Actinokineospora terrae]SES18805.1 Lysophospholipase, alpha-beta hydrolase superfamily [Actinokineospora terrae]